MASEDEEHERKRVANQQMAKALRMLPEPAATDLLTRLLIDAEAEGYRAGRNDNGIEMYRRSRQRGWRHHKR